MTSLSRIPVSGSATRNSGDDQPSHLALKSIQTESSSFGTQALSRVQEGLTSTRAWATQWQLAVVGNVARRSMGRVLVQLGLRAMPAVFLFSLLSEEYASAKLVEFLGLRQEDNGHVVKFEMIEGGTTQLVSGAAMAAMPGFLKGNFFVTSVLVGVGIVLGQQVSKGLGSKIVTGDLSLKNTALRIVDTMVGVGRGRAMQRAGVTFDGSDRSNELRTTVDQYSFKPHPPHKAPGVTRQESQGPVFKGGVLQPLEGQTWVNYVNADYYGPRTSQAAQRREAARAHRKVEKKETAQFLVNKLEEAFKLRPQATLGAAGKNGKVNREFLLANPTKIPDAFAWVMLDILLDGKQKRESLSVKDRQDLGRLLVILNQAPWVEIVREDDDGFVKTLDERREIIGMEISPANSKACQDEISRLYAAELPVQFYSFMQSVADDHGWGTTTRPIGWVDAYRAKRVVEEIDTLATDDFDYVARAKKTYSSPVGWGVVLQKLRPVIFYPHCQEVFDAALKRDKAKPASKRWLLKPVEGETAQQHLVRSSLLWWCLLPYQQKDQIDSPISSYIKQKFVMSRGNYRFDVAEIAEQVAKRYHVLRVQLHLTQKPSRQEVKALVYEAERIETVMERAKSYGSEFYSEMDGAFKALSGFEFDYVRSVLHLCKKAQKVRVGVP